MKGLGDKIKGWALPSASTSCRCSGSSSDDPLCFTGRGKFDLKSYLGSPSVALDERSSSREVKQPQWGAKSLLSRAPAFPQNQLTEVAFFPSFSPARLQNEKHLRHLAVPCPPATSAVWVEEDLKVSNATSYPPHVSIYLLCGFWSKIHVKADKSGFFFF